jgi:hypothetical protein
MAATIYTNCLTLTLGCFLYQDAGLTTPVSNGEYSDGTDVFTVTGGAGEITASALCNPPTTTTTTTTTTIPTTSTTTTSTTIIPTTSTTTSTTTTAPLIGNIDIVNGSLDVVISQVDFNGVTATFVAGVYPNTTGNGTSLNTTEIGTYTLDVFKNNSVSGQHITVTDSNGTPQCIFFGSGAATLSYSGVVYDGITNIQIDAQDGAC